MTYYIIQFARDWGIFFGTLGFGTFDLLYLTVCEGYGAHLTYFLGHWVYFFGIWDIRLSFRDGSYLAHFLGNFLGQWFGEYFFGHKKEGSTWLMYMQKCMTFPDSSLMVTHS